MITSIETLSNSEVREFEKHEATIERGRKTFVEVGNALMAIRDKKLYRTTYGTFESYCRERWEFGRQRAAALIEAAEVANSLSEISDRTPKNEAQAHALAAVPPPQRQEIWNEAVETAPNGKVTAAHVTATAAKKSGQAVREPASGLPRGQRPETDFPYRTAPSSRPTPPPPSPNDVVRPAPETVGNAVPGTVGEEPALPPFIVNLDNDAFVGKTAALRAAGSHWGNPGESSPPASAPPSIFANAADIEAETPITAGPSLSIPEPSQNTLLPTPRVQALALLEQAMTLLSNDEDDNLKSYVKRAVSRARTLAFGTP